MLDIAPDALAIVRAILGRHVPEHEVWAFGSRARGSARRYSDLDLAVISQTRLPFEVIGGMREAFSESDLPFRVDIVDWAGLPDNFRHVVEQERIVVQSGSEDRSG